MAALSGSRGRVNDQINRRRSKTFGLSSHSASRPRLRVCMRSTVIGQPAGLKLDTGCGVQDRVERHIATGRQDLIQGQPRQRTEIAGSRRLLDAEINSAAPDLIGDGVQRQTRGVDGGGQARTYPPHLTPES